jgi:hypothetical protein
MITDYPSLQTELQSWLWNRSDVVARIPTFIQLTEAQMNRRLTARLKTAVNAAFMLDAELVDVPADFAGAISLRLQTDPARELVFKTPDGIAQLWDRRAPGATTGRPFAYTVTGSQFQLFRVPDQPYTATLIYRQRIPALSDGNPSNWVLAHHPDAYLYGALLQSAPWLKHDERVAMWAQAFDQVLTDIQTADVVETLAANLAPQTGMVV